MGTVAGRWGGGREGEVAGVGREESGGEGEAGEGEVDVGVLPDVHDGTGALLPDAPHRVPHVREPPRQQPPDPDVQRHRHLRPVLERAGGGGGGGRGGGEDASAADAGVTVDEDGAGDGAELVAEDVDEPGGGGLVVVRALDGGQGDLPVRPAVVADVEELPRRGPRYRVRILKVTRTSPTLFG